MPFCAFGVLGLDIIQQITDAPLEFAALMGPVQHTHWCSGFLLFHIMDTFFYMWQMSYTSVFNCVISQGLAARMYINEILPPV